MSDSCAIGPRGNPCLPAGGRSRSFFARRTALAVPALLMSGLLHAQTFSAATLADTVVSATRTQQPLSDLVADVTVLDRAEIERSGVVGLADVLVRVPGLEMVRNGGPGNRTDIFIRGSESRFVAVFIDGVRVDSQSTGGAPWESIPLAQIERIEIVRGPAAAVYGSDAIGGVIQVFTQQGQGAFVPYVGIGVGSIGLHQWEAGLRGSKDAFDYAIGLARSASTGFHVRTLPGYNQDDDGFVSESLSARLGWRLSAAHRLEANVLSSSVDAQYDASAKKPASTYDDHTVQLLETRGLNWRGKWSESYSTLFGVTQSLAKYETTPSVYLTVTRLDGYLLQNEFRFGQHALTAALERKVDHLENGPTNPIDRNRTQDALALGYGWSGVRHSLQLNLRHDQDSEFGGQDSGSAAYGFALTPQWRVTASTGTAYRVPTLFQRFGSSGLASLQVETGRNLELGIRYTEGSTSWGLVAYRNQIDNLITFVRNTGGCPNNVPPTKGPVPGCYFNTAQAEYTGVSLSGQRRWASVDWRASLDVQSMRDTATNNFLPRRANHHASVSAQTQLGVWSVGSDVQLSGARYDDANNTTPLPGYALWGLHGSRRLHRDWTLQARIDNLTDTSYVLVSGYATAARSLYLGLKWAPLD